MHGCRALASLLDSPLLPPGLNYSWKVRLGSRLSRGQPPSPLPSLCWAGNTHTSAAQASGFGDKKTSQRLLSSEASFPVSQVRMKSGRRQPRRLGRQLPGASEVLGHQHPGARWGRLAEGGDTACDSASHASYPLQTQGSFLGTRDRAGPRIGHLQPSSGAWRRMLRAWHCIRTPVWGPSLPFD